MNRNILEYELTIDCKNAGPEKYITHPDSNFEQFCYYDQNKNDRLFNKFLAKRISQENSSLVFEIDSVIITTKMVKLKFIKQFRNYNHS